MINALTKIFKRYSQQMLLLAANYVGFKTIAYRLKTIIQPSSVLCLLLRQTPMTPLSSVSSLVSAVHPGPVILAADVQT